MRFDTFVNEITAAGFQAVRRTPLLIGAYLAWRRQGSRRRALVVAQVR